MMAALGEDIWSSFVEGPRIEPGIAALHGDPLIVRTHGGPEGLQQYIDTYQEPGLLNLSNVHQLAAFIGLSAASCLAALRLTNPDAEAVIRGNKGLWNAASVLSLASFVMNKICATRLNNRQQG